MSSTLDQPAAIKNPFSVNGDKNIIPETATGTQAASLEEGFPPITSTPISQGGIPPQREDFNGLGYLLSSQYFFLQNGGRFTFSSDVSTAIGGYPKDAILQYTGEDSSYQVKSLINNNTYDFVSDPSYIDGIHWKKVYEISPDDWVTVGTTQTITGSKTFTQSVNLSGIDVTSGVNSNKDIVFYDTNTQPFAILRGIHQSDNSRRLQIGTRNADGTSSGVIQIITASNGTVSTSCPSSAQSNINNWPINSIVTLLSRSVNGTNGHIKLGPVILQWGRATPPSRTWTNVMLTGSGAQAGHINFSNANYLVFLTDDGTEGSGATTFKVSSTKYPNYFRIYADSNATVQDSCSWFAIGF